jgi:two-component system sensor kinase FixL
VIEHHLMLIAQSSDQQRIRDLKREELAAALACSEARLRDASSELARLQRQFTLGQFASAVVHEMNQPLSAAQSSLDAAFRWLDRPEPDVPAALTAIARAAEVGRRAQETMAGLRAMAKPQVAEPVDLNLHEVVREVAFMAHEDAIHARVDVRLDLAADAQWIKGDRSQLHLALHNLMRNAIDAMATVTDRRRELRIATLPAEDRGVDILVEDTGTGFDAETAARMFRSSFSTKIRGMGMGLMICRAVVEGHGGSIRAESRADGQGGRFILSLPGPADLALP